MSIVLVDMINRVFTILLLFAFTVISCKDGRSYCPVYHVSVNSAMPLLQIDQIFTISDIITLDSPERGLSDAVSVRVEDETIILNDRRMNSFHVFDKTGRLLHSFNKEGNGPGEYLSTFRFDYREDTEEILVYDSMKAKILHYSTDGTFVNEDSVKVAPVGSFKYYQGKTYFDNKFNRFDGENGFSVIVLDSLQNIVQQILPYDTPWDLRITPRESFFTVEDTLVYQPPFSQTVYSITKDGKCFERFSLDFGSHNLQESTVFLKHGSSIEYYNKLSESGAVLYLNYHENRDYLYLDFSVRDIEYLALIRKSNGECLVLNIDGNSCKSPYKPLAVKDNRFISLDDSNPDFIRLLFLEVNSSRWP